MNLPDCDDLYMKYFDPWYQEDYRKNRDHDGAFPDPIQLYNPNIKAAEICTFTDESRARILKQIKTMFSAAINDWKDIIHVDESDLIKWIKHFDQYFTKERIFDLINESDPKEFSNEYLVTCCEFGAVIGEFFVVSLDVTEWGPAWPYWDSAVLDFSTGYVIYPFHWAIKKMSEYGYEDGYAQKCLACYELIKNHWKG